MEVKKRFDGGRFEEISLLLHGHTHTLTLTSTHTHTHTHTLTLTSTHTGTHKGISGLFVTPITQKTS